MTNSTPGKPVPVLNGGFVRPVNSMGSDLEIVRVAKVSSEVPGEERRDRDLDEGSKDALRDRIWRRIREHGWDPFDPRLDEEIWVEVKKGNMSTDEFIYFLMIIDMSSPFEAVAATFEVKAPIFVLRQWHRHRTQSYNETSARFQDMGVEYYLPENDQIIAQLDDDQRENIDLDAFSDDIRQAMDKQNQQAFKTYNRLLKKGCPREVARSVLPLGTYSHMIATANLRNWFGFLRQRLHPSAQYEIQVYAQEILNELKKMFPIACQAFEDHCLYRRSRYYKYPWWW